MVDHQGAFADDNAIILGLGLTPLDVKGGQGIALRVENTAAR